MKRLLAVFALAGAPGALACEPALEDANAVRLESARYVLAYVARPMPIRVGRHFGLEVAACGRNGTPAPEALRLDAHMPAHRHGMNYAPSIRPAGGGRWQAQGLMFHMPGEWEFRFDLRAAGTTDRLTHRYTLD